MRDALRDVGLAGRPRATAERGRHVGYLEAHIEQGQTLESGGLAIGVVTSIVGIWQYRITFDGRAKSRRHHTDGRPQGRRPGAGEILRRNRRAVSRRSCGPRTVWTTGRITLDPGAPSIIPGRAEMLFQIRDDDPDVIDRLEALLRDMAAETSAQGRCTVAVERIRTGAPALMNAAFQQAIEAAGAACAGGRSIRMPSRRRSRRPDSRHHHARGHAVRAFDRRRQPSLEREHRGRRHRHRCRGLRRRLPPPAGGMNFRWLGLYGNDLWTPRAITCTC